MLLYFSLFSIYFRTPRVLAWLDAVGKAASGGDNFEEIHVLASGGGENPSPDPRTPLRLY